MASFLETLLALNRAGMPMGNLPPMPVPAPSMPLMLPNASLPQINPMALPPPEIAPPAPIDENAIRNRLLSLAGPAPTPPPPPPDPGFLEKLAVALQGFGAGVQGQGPQFVQSVREQRERPQKEFKQKQERYEERQFQLGLAGEEAVSQARARREARLAEQDDKFFQRERDEIIRRTGMQDREAIARLEASLTAERDARLAARAEEQAKRQARAVQERDARLIARDYGKLTDNPKIAQELGNYYAGLTDTLSPTAAKFETAQARLAEARARRAAGGGAADPFAGMSVETAQGIVPLKVYAALKDILGEPKRFLMAGKPIPIGGGAPKTDAELAATAKQAFDKGATDQQIRQAMETDGVPKAKIDQILKSLPRTLAPPPPRFQEPGATGAFGGKTLGEAVPDIYNAIINAQRTPQGPKVGTGGRREPVK